MEEKKEKSSQFPYLPLIRDIPSRRGGTGRSRAIRGKKNPLTSSPPLRAILYFPALTPDDRALHDGSSGRGRVAPLKKLEQVHAAKSSC